MEGDAPPTISVAVLDDYQGLATRLGPWRRLGAGIELQAFTDHLDDEDALAARLERFDVIVAMRERTPFPRSLLARLPRLALLVTTGMANAAIDLDAARDRGVLVAGTGSAPSATAELTWALILALTRHVHEEDAAIRAGGWQHTIGPELYGRTLGVVGLGRQGARVAGYGLAFGMRVIAWSRNLDPARAAAIGVEATGFDDLLSSSDIVTVHMRHSEDTTGLIGARELALMSLEAYLVNTSRGPIVDEAALLEALAAGTIAGAALDVFDREPLPAGHPLRSAPNTLLTPHIGYVARDTYEIFFAHAVEDIEAWRAGQPIRLLDG
jgi:phosphoglycerate dehydrogenase-like enzyme